MKAISNKSIKNRGDYFFLRFYDIMGLIGLPPLLYAIVRFVFTAAYGLHPMLGLVLSVVFIILAIFALKGFSKKKAEFFGQPTRLVLSLFAIVVMISLAGFSCLSYALYGMGLAQYTSNKPIHPGTLADHYVWHLIDMIPGLKVWSTLKIDDPMQSTGLGAGIPLILFRLFVIVPFIALVKKWLDFRRERAEAPLKESVST